MVLSATQMKYLALAWECFEDPNPKVDLEKFHKLAGLASVNSARELLRVTKIKLKAEYGALSADVAGGNAARAGGTPKSTPKKSNIANGNGTPRKTPTTTPGKKRGRKAAVELTDRTKVNGNADADADGDDDEEVLGASEAGSPSKKVKAHGAAAKVKREDAHEGLGSGEEEEFLG